MSSDIAEPRPSDEDALICEFCGGEIVDDGQACPALDDGRCRP